MVVDAPLSRPRKSFRDAIIERVKGCIMVDGALQAEHLPVDDYFDQVDLWVGQWNGSGKRCMLLASALEREVRGIRSGHYTQCTSCDHTFVLVRRRCQNPQEMIDLSRVMQVVDATQDGWPQLDSLDGHGRMVRSLATPRAALLWPISYNFITDDSRSLLNLVTHINGNSVAPALAAAIARAAAKDHEKRNSSLAHLLDGYCGGGGFSIGAIPELPNVRHVELYDNDEGVRACCVANVQLLMEDRQSPIVTSYPDNAPRSFNELCKLIGVDTYDGWHIHISPPCASTFHTLSMPHPRFVTLDCALLRQQERPRGKSLHRPWLRPRSILGHAGRGCWERCHSLI